MWPAPPTLRQMLGMLWTEFKKDLRPAKECAICGSPKPTEFHRRLLVCRGCHRKIQHP
jgi:ribosomal protein S14